LRISPEPRWLKRQAIPEAVLSHRTVSVMAKRMESKTTIKKLQWHECPCGLIVLLIPIAFYSGDLDDWQGSVRNSSGVNGLSLRFLTRALQISIAVKQQERPLPSQFWERSAAVDENSRSAE
jgi:hypothetical protein